MYNPLFEIKEFYRASDFEEIKKAHATLPHAVLSFILLHFNKKFIILLTSTK